MSSDRRRALRAQAALPAAALAGGLGSLVADGLELDAADARFVAVAFPALVSLLAARAAREGTPRGARIGLAVLSAPLPLALLWPHPALVSWLSGGVVVLGAEAVGYAAWTASRLARRTSKSGSGLPARRGSTLLARLALGALGAAAPAYLWAAATVVLFNTQLIVAPVRLAHLDPALAEGEVSVDVAGPEGLTLRGTFTPASGRGPAVVLHHGVSDGRRRFAPWARRLRAEGSPSLRFDARAHGVSDGAVCTYGQREAADLVAVTRALRARVGPERPLVAVGTSMGGGVVLAASAGLRRLGVRALIVLAPASDYPELVDARTAALGPLREPVLAGSAALARAMGQLPMTDWSPAARLDPALPVLALHGVEDRTIPIVLSERLARERANVHLVRLAGVGHDELPGVVAEDAAAWAEVRRALDAAGR